MTSPRNPSIFEPRREFMEVLDRIIRQHEDNPSNDLAAMIADSFLTDAQDRGGYSFGTHRDTVYTTDRMPRGFKVLVTIQPEQNATILGGLELVDGRKYNVVVRVRTYRSNEDKTQTWRGWTFFESMRYGHGGFALVKNGVRGPFRWPYSDTLVSIEEAEDA